MISDVELIYDFLSSPGPVPDHADVIIALGTHDLRVADYAAEIFLSGRAPLLICSGGLGKVTGSLFTRPEAELFMERCCSLGVPPENILLNRHRRQQALYGKTGLGDGNEAVAGSKLERDDPAALSGGIR